MPCAICSGQAMHLCAPLPPEKLNRLHHVALLTRSWQYTTYAAICNMKRFALLGLMHPHRDACVQTVLPSVPLPPERPNGLHVPCDALVPGRWQCTTDAEAATQAFGANACTQTAIPVCNLCRAGHASACPLANSESEQAAPREALVFGSWQCITYAAICNMMRFALSGLVHPHSDGCVQTVLPRPCNYVSSCLLRGRTDCTVRCFGVWGLAMHPYAEACMQCTYNNLGSSSDLGV